MSIVRTVNSVISTASGVACAVVDLPIIRGDHVSTPAVHAVGETHDVLVLLQTDQLAVTRTSEVVVAMVLERGASCAGRVIGGGCEQHRRRCKHGCESDEDHGCGDGGVSSCRYEVLKVPVLYTSRCGLCSVSGVPIYIHCENRSHLRPRSKRVHTCKALIAFYLVVS
jgi:hypothetical protein